MYVSLATRHTQACVLSTLNTKTSPPKMQDYSSRWPCCQETPRNSAGSFGIAQWKNFVPVSYCRTVQELLIIGIHSGGSKRAFFCARCFFERLQISCTKIFTVELIDVSRLQDLNKRKIEEFFYIPVFVWNPRSTSETGRLLHVLDHWLND